MRSRKIPCAVALCLAAACAATPQAEQRTDWLEAISLLGRPLFAPALDAERRAELEADLAWAEATLAAEPDSEDAVVWVGRRLAYLGRYREAVAVYTRGLRDHPGSYKLLRHRGHRYISLRDFGAAVEDLSLAARRIRDVPNEIEPDGAPNALGIPTSTSHGNIWYHLALAHYLQGDFERALAAQRECLRTSTNDDMLCASSYWLYMTLRRLGRPAQARAALIPIRADLDVIENHAYHRLLLFFKGELDQEDLFEGVAAGTVASPTTMYGLGNWHLFEGRPGTARKVFLEVVDGGVWAAFGHIAAEAELAAVAR